MVKKGSEKAGFFHRVGDAVLGVDKLPGKMKRKVPKLKRKPPPKKPEIPQMLRSFFERRHTNWPEYVMLKAQMGILALFVASVFYIVVLPTQVFVFVPLLLALSACLVYLTFTQLKRAFEFDFPAYRSFMFMSIAIAWIFVLALRHSPVEYSLEAVHLAIVPPLLAILFVAAAFSAFRFKYGRNFTFGTVEQARGRRAVVRVGYDIRSNVKAGLYPVESFIGVKKGDFVKMSVERSLLGLRGSKVGAVIEKPTSAKRKI